MILDCTLRDGGYYTNWDFDKSLVTQYLAAMEKLPIDYVELGYRSMPLSGYYGEYFYLPEPVLKYCKELCSTTKLAIMLNAKDVTIELIPQLLDPCVPYVDLVRIAVNPNEIDHALSLTKAIKAKGFEVGFNIMYMSTWKTLEGFWSRIEETRGLVDFVWLVDSFGGVFPTDINEIVKEVVQKTDAKLGFHGHDNLEMAFYNSLTALAAGCSIIDATMTGMGRGAGNLKTELLLTYIAQKQSNVAFHELTDIVSAFENLRRHYEWGTNLPYMISGMNSLPQKDIMEWMSQKRYSVTRIVQALQHSTDKQKETISYDKFHPQITTNDFLIIGGGDSVKAHIEAIQLYISERKESLTVIFSSTKFLPLFGALSVNSKRYLCLVGSEGVRLKRYLTAIKPTDYFVLSPQPWEMGTFVPNEVKLQTKELAKYQIKSPYHDSPLRLALEVALAQAPTAKICLIGFDGYDAQSTADSYDLMQENQQVISSFVDDFGSLQTLTESKYDRLNKSSIYAFL